MTVARTLTVAGVALGGAAFWMAAVTDTPSANTSSPAMTPPSVSREVMLVDTSSSLVDPSCTDPLCVLSGRGGMSALDVSTAAALPYCDHCIVRIVDLICNW